MSTKSHKNILEDISLILYNKKLNDEELIHTKLKIKSLEILLKKEIDKNKFLHSQLNLIIIYLSGTKFRAYLRSASGGAAPFYGFSGIFLEIFFLYIIIFFKF